MAGYEGNDDLERGKKAMSQKRQYTVFEGEEERSWSVETIGEGLYRVTTPQGVVRDVDAYSPGANQLHLVVEDRSVNASLVELDGVVEVQIDGGRHEVMVLNDRERRMRAVSGGASGADAPELTSPMAGKVVKLIAASGQSVELGEPLVVVEAMKMENDLKAHRSGVVGAVVVDEGDAVEVGDVLVMIEDEPGGGEQ